MLKQTVQFYNVDNILVARDLYFNLTRTELNEQNALSDGQFETDLRSIGNSNKMSEAYPIIQRVIGLGYGIRTADGDFYKSTTDWERFKGSLAYNQLMEDILFKDPANNGALLATFVKAMLPPDIQAEINEREAQPGFRPGANTDRPVPPDGISGPNGANVIVGQAVISDQNAPSAVQAETPQIQQPVIPPAEANLVEQISTPRTDLIGGS